MKIKKNALGIAALALAVLLAGAGSGQAGSGWVENSRASVLQLGTVELRDPNMNNAVAARVAVPQGWSFKKYEIAWEPALYGDPARVFYHLQGPVDEVEFATLSQQKFNFNQSWITLSDFMYNEILRMTQEQCNMAQQYTPATAQQFCAQAQASAQPELQKLQQNKAALLSGQTAENGVMVRQPMWAADVAQWLLRENKEITNVRVIKIERPTDLEQLLRKAVVEQDAQMRRLAAQLNLPFKGLSFDVARVYFNYAQNGKRYDGVSLVVTEYCTFVSNQQLPALSGYSGPDPLYGQEYVLWNIRVNSATALEGRLQAHEPVLATIAANSAVDPMWQAAVDRLAAEITQKINEAKHRGQMKMLQSQLEHQQTMQQMRNETYSYINQRQKEVFANRSESLSRASTGMTDAIVGRQRWQGSNTKYVAPNNYKYAWEGPDGKTIFSNDSMFNPNTSSGHSGSWTVMNQVPN